MSPDKSLDLLGIKGLSDSVKVATQGFVDGAAAFLSLYRTRFPGHTFVLCRLA